MSFQVIRVKNFEEMALDKWYCYITWYSLQCYMHKEKDGIHYILYLRWRHQDPWQAHIIKHAKDEDSMINDDAEWTSDLFEEYELFFEDEEYKQAKDKLIALWEGKRTDDTIKIDR